MTSVRTAPLALLVLLAAAGCAKSRSPETPAAGMVTFAGGAADESDVTVDGRWCTRCHGDPARAPLATDSAGIAFAPPVDTDAATTGAKVGAHLAHLRGAAGAPTWRAAGVDCANCHVIPAIADAHTPGVGFRGLAATFYPNKPVVPAPSYVGSTCNNTYCHGGFPGGLARSVTWTGTSADAGCGTCHGFPPALRTDGVTAHVQFPAFTTCGDCHEGYSGASVNTSLHIDGKVDLNADCTGCHGTHLRSNGGIAGVTYDPHQPAAPPLDTANNSTGILVGVHLAHANPTPSTAGASEPTGGVYKPIACTECHPDNTSAIHSNGSVDVTFAAATGANLAGYTPTFVKTTGNPLTCSTYCHGGVGGGSVGTWSWTGAAAACGSCHAFPPASHTGVVASATACNGCHDGTVNTDGTINIAGGLHINGTVDGGESIGGQSCGDCHSAIFNAMNGTVAKTSRHALTSDSPTFNTAINWSDPLGSNAVAVRSCTNMCHDDHPHTLGGSTTTHEYNVYADANARATAPTTTSRSKTDFDAAATNGGLCVSCHRFGIVTAGGPTIGKAAFDASAHDFVTASGSTWEFRLHTTTGATDAFQRNCTKCHASSTEGTTPSITVTSSGANSVHFSTNDSLLAGSTTLTPTVTDLVCYNCHGSAAPVDGAQGDRSGKNIQGQFAKASTHAVTGVTCRSCHDPHKAKAGTHATPGNLAGPPIEGAAGAQLTGTVAFFAAPVAGNFTAKTVVAGTDVEATLCFKCHSAFGTLPAGTTDVAREFNPANAGNWYTTGTTTTWSTGETAGGFHPILADAGNNLGRINMANLVTTNFPWRTTGARNLMTCTDCHESDTTTDPNGPHGSAANFILKGPNTAWSATLINNGTMNGAFCANCHSSSFSSSRFSAHTRNDHYVACFKCHAAIPHGGPRPGMLAAGAGAATAVGGTIAGWDATAPYWQGGTGNRLYLFSYPTNGTNAWSQGNCGCNGTGH